MAKILVLSTAAGSAGAQIEVELDHRLSLDDADGNTSVFSFDAPILELIACFLGGIPQLPADISVDGNGNVVLADNVTKPVVPVTVLALWPIYD